VTVDPAAVREQVETIVARLVAAGRPIELVAVTKGFGPDALDAAAAAGCTRVGENYAQELLAKWPQRTTAAHLDVHFIGRLQSNKIRALAPLVDVWETIDRLPLVAELARRAPGATILVQVNATGETDKGGCVPSDVPGLVEQARGAGLVVDGVMAVGPTDGDPAATAAAFATARSLTDRLGLATCSMGMTHDLDLAIAAGTTRVRIGTALFGPRGPHGDVHRSPDPLR
jgi:pyridoxal phosphate enzyme (YggS family)